jgi:hypothetical protein
MKKEIIRIEPISPFTYKADGSKERTEIEHYSDGSEAKVFAYYAIKDR